ncbi:MAG: cardiolipin synthase [Bacteroidales bacterium]|nr:cardiolipin synthase [Bacteroidales bacterium]MCF8455258.1 cardiolipin synthase [Bacteroidales bacterium]
MDLQAIKYDIFNWFQIEGMWAIIIRAIIFIFIAFPLVVILFENRNPIKSIAWIMVLILLPIVGIILYLYFGRNYRKEKIFTRKEFADAESSRQLYDPFGIDIEEVEKNSSEKIKSKLKLMKLLLNNSRARLTIGNLVKVLNNGKETFDSIFIELDRAKHHIHLEYYIIEDDEIGNRVKNKLIEIAKRGVKIRLIFDDVGSWSLSDDYLNDLRDVGVEIYSFMRVRTYRFANKINYRNHRKILVVDGKVGFVGGVNIADRYLKGRDGKGFWRDTHLRIEGDAVKNLQIIFLMDWYFMSNKIINDKIYFPDHHVDEKHLIQITTSGPDSDWANIMQTFFSAIATASEYVYISTPYFLPNESILTAMRTAALSGVDVKIILPEKNDSWLTNYSSRSYIQDLIEAGVEVFLYTKGFTHSKLLMVDDVFATVGTTNMDIRSFDQNFEVNALIYDEDITAEIKSAFIEDLSNSERVDFEKFQNRPLKQKFLESLARLFSPLL